MKLFKKKGQLAEGSVNAIITLIVGVGISVLALIFVGAMGGQTYNIVEPKILEIGNQTTTNYSFTVTTNVSQYIGHTSIHAETFVVTNSTGVVYGSGNYTLTASTGMFTDLTGHVNGSTMLASYRWGDLSIQTNVKDGIISGFEALKQTGDYLPIIVLAVVIALVLAIVLSFTSLGMTSGNRGAL